MNTPPGAPPMIGDDRKAALDAVRIARAMLGQYHHIYVNELATLGVDRSARAAFELRLTNAALLFLTATRDNHNETKNKTHEEAKC